MNRAPRMVRLPFRRGALLYVPDRGDAIIPANFVFATTLITRHLDPHGHLIAESDEGSGLVTTAGVNLLAADWTNATATLKLANYHDSGTGTIAAAIGDAALGAADANHTARQAGTQTNPVAGTYKTVGTLTYTAATAVTEWGLFSAVTAGTLWDRKVFTVINVANGDSIQFSYSLVVNSGG